MYIQMKVKYSIHVIHCIVLFDYLDDMNWQFVHTEYGDDFDFEFDVHNTSLPNLRNKGKNIMGCQGRKLDFCEKEPDDFTAKFNHDTGRDLHWLHQIV